MLLLPLLLKRTKKRTSNLYLDVKDISSLYILFCLVLLWIVSVGFLDNYIGLYSWYRVICCPHIPTGTKGIILTSFGMYSLQPVFRFDVDRIGMEGGGLASVILFGIAGVYFIFMDGVSMRHQPSSVIIESMTLFSCY